MSASPPTCSKDANANHLADRVILSGNGENSSEQHVAIVSTSPGIKMPYPTKQA